MIKTMAASSGSLQRQIEALGPWFHNLHLPDGTQTAPGHFLGDFPAFKWRKIAGTVPADLSGWTVLDIGCNAGFYSIELAKRGARVTAFDVEPLYLDQARWALRQFGLEDRIELSRGRVYDLIHEPRRFDLVWFTGVFYHLRSRASAGSRAQGHPQAAHGLMFQTLAMPGNNSAEPPSDMHIDHREPMLDPGWPKLAYIEKRLAGDESNWWAPNHACVEALLRTAGLRVLAKPDHEFYYCEVTEERDPRATAELEDVRCIATGRSAF